MEKLQKMLKPLVLEAVRDAMFKHGLEYTSKHEMYGVLAEEVLEAREEYDMIRGGMEDLLDSIHLGQDSMAKTDLEGIRASAERLACEAIQIAAVCVKAKGLMQA